MSSRITSVVGGLLTLVFVVGAFPNTASADHRWNNYHWARTEDTFNLRLVHKLDSQWVPHLNQAVADWNQDQTNRSVTTNYPTVVNFIPQRNVLEGGCEGQLGRVEVCNDEYGYTGWLGLTQIWVADSQGHLNQVLVKYNDTYFNLPAYNTPEWRQYTMCHEIGHTIGLDHVDNDFDTSLGTCMDVSSNAAENMQPNEEDFTVLESIYGHLDTFRTHEYILRPELELHSVAPEPADWRSGPRAVKFGHRKDLNNERRWGRAVEQDEDGNDAVFVKRFKDGSRLITKVIWTPETPVGIIGSGQAPETADTSSDGQAPSVAY